ncbi:hypothetical protein ETAA8_39370 [Anatilimnocola aggregata]|uniref:Uncharacterized protein n=1 Tax=Anatilimnocola aggregata TaxID=2528021 RepID=A0A517YFB1_9BACT|nr:hypothetical protein [Anatilimnocola aggregata]QDU28832.1 hypothetical protein ETAA8_39370 [Anatilimnocola aggregata]
MAHPMDLRELLEARDGRPTEYQAARKIATFAVIPAAMVGLLAGTQLVDIADPIGRLLWVCTATALVSGFGIAFLVLGVYYLFGFRPLAVLADALVGGFIGLLCGAALTMSLISLKVVPRAYSLCPLVLIPFGAVAVPLFRAWRGATRERETVGQDAASEAVKGSRE